jgi:hypothetical protein
MWAGHFYVSRLTAFVVHGEVKMNYHVSENGAGVTIPEVHSKRVRS